MILFLISWILVGFISLILVCVYDMRGKEFDPNYFKGYEIVPIILIASGYVSIIFIVIYYMCEKKIFAKILYKISNIGVNTQKKDEK